MNGDNFSENSKYEVIDSTELIARFIGNMTKVDNDNQIIKAWRAIIESIRPNSKVNENAENFGRNLASHSKIVDFKNGVILVEADHSSWLQMLQLYKKYILGSLQRRFPELNISSLAFKLRGTNARLSISYEDSVKIAMENRNRKMAAENRILEKKGFTKIDDKNIPELPPELKALFDNVRKSIESSS